MQDADQGHIANISKGQSKIFTEEFGKEEVTNGGLIIGQGHGKASQTVTCRQLKTFMLEDDKPIAQMFQKESKTSGKVIKDVWVMSKKTDEHGLSQIKDIWATCKAKQLERDTNSTNYQLRNTNYMNSLKENTNSRSKAFEATQNDKKRKISTIEPNLESGTCEQILNVTKPRPRTTDSYSGNNENDLTSSEIKLSATTTIKFELSRSTPNLFSGKNKFKTNKPLSVSCREKSDTAESIPNGHKEKKESLEFKACYKDEVDRSQHEMLNNSPYERKAIATKENDVQEKEWSTSSDLDTHLEITENGRKTFINKDYVCSVNSFPTDPEKISTHSYNNDRTKPDEAERSRVDQQDYESNEDESDWSSEPLTPSSRNQKFPRFCDKHRKSKIKKCSCKHRRCKMENCMAEVAEQNGFVIVDVPNDGNCMFACVVDQLYTCGEIEYTTKSLRSAVVRYLQENPYQADGTHLESFLNYETWEEYLDRIKNDAEWGDHITLKAIADILQRCITIFNVSLNNQSETMLQPSNIDCNQQVTKRTLYLGHYGEEHFVSLRPADWEDTWFHYKEEKNVKQEDVTSMKSQTTFPRYIEDKTSLDTISHTPLPHYSFLLKYLIKPKYLQCKQQQGITVTSNSNMELAGSIIEGLNFELTDISRSRSNKVATNPYVVCCRCHKNCHTRSLSCALMIHIEEDSKVIYSDENVALRNYVTGVTSDTNPGYVKLRVINPDAWCTDKIHWSEDQIPYLKHLQVTHKATGSTDPKMLSKRLVKGIWHPSWPDTASEWIQRKRSSNWPPPSLISKVINDGCFVVSRSHPRCEDLKIVWQFLFSAAELKLVKEGFSQAQLHCFGLFKVLIDCHTRNLPKQLSTNHLKHVMFYSCEVIPTSYWSENPGGCMLYLLDRLLENLRSHSMPNYFIKENNMIDHYPVATIQGLHDKIESLRGFPILSLIFICKRHGFLQEVSIDSILEDVKCYRKDLDLYGTVKNVFIPYLIDLENVNLHCQSCETFLHHLQETYELILSTPPNSKRERIPDFQEFLANILAPGSSEILLERLFLALFLDRHFKTTVMAQLATGTECITLRQVLGEDNEGSYGDMLIPKSKLDCVDIIIMFSDVLLRFRLYEHSAFYLRCGISKVKEEKEALRVEVGDQDHVSNENIRKTMIRQTSLKRKICNNNIYILFRKLYTCYSYMNQYELIQEYLGDFEVVSEELESVNAYEFLAKLYRYLGNEEKGKEIDQKIISLGGKPPEIKTVAAIIA